MGLNGPSVLGHALAVCDVPPERHALTLSPQYRQGGTWKTAESATGAAIPNPRAVYEVKTGCRPGLWRVHAGVVGPVQGRDFEFEDRSVERFLTADDCARANR